MGFEPLTTMSGKEKSFEYLLDLCWNVIDQKEIWLEMVLESELSERKVESTLYDFEKLTDVKAFLKIGIFHPQIKRVEEIALRCAELIRRHRIKITGTILGDFLDRETEKQKMVPESLWFAV